MPLVRCGKWPGPATTGSGCALRFPDLGSRRQVLRRSLRRDTHRERCFRRRIEKLRSPAPRSSPMPASSANDGGGWAMRMTERKPRRITAEKRKRTTRRRPKGTSARNIELYSSAYRIAWKQISPLQKREQPTIALRLHASIRRLLKKGATDPSLIASEALKALEEVGRERIRPAES
jgi:hypothetical protein